MKKLLLGLMVGAATWIGIETPSHAQFYTPYAYNNNAYLNYSIARQKAKATGRKARVSKRSPRSRCARSIKRTRRASHR